MADSFQLTQGGGAKVRRPVNQLSWEGPVQNYVILTGISEQPDLSKRIFNNHRVDFCHYRMYVYTHLQHTFIYFYLIFFMWQICCSVFTWAR